MPKRQNSENEATRAKVFSAHVRGRDFGTSAFAGADAGEEDVDPMSGIANLSDAMLVFACGLMLALIVHWNVDIGSLTPVTQQEDMEAFDNTSEITESTEDGGKGYEELGMAYRDPETGQIYITVEE